MVESDKANTASDSTMINQSTANSVAPADGLAVRRNVENSSRKITDYHLLRVIGTGTFGKVYLALLDEKPVALKALKKTQMINLK